MQEAAEFAPRAGRWRMIVCLERLNEPLIGQSSK